jgi:hypothetical protein
MKKIGHMVKNLKNLLFLKFSSKKYSEIIEFGVLSEEIRRGGG